MGERSSAARVFAESAFSKPLPALLVGIGAVGADACAPNPKLDIRFELRSCPISPFTFLLSGGNSSAVLPWVWEALPWLLPNLNDPWADGSLDDEAKRSSCGDCCDGRGVPWFLWTRPPRLLDPAVDHIDDWPAFGS